MGQMGIPLGLLVTAHAANKVVAIILLADLGCCIGLSEHNTNCQHLLHV